MNHLRPFRGSTWLSVVLALAILSVTVITPNAQAAVRPQNATPTSARLPHWKQVHQRLRNCYRSLTVFANVITHWLLA